MACHVYNLVYCKMLAIVVCYMQFGDTKAQQLMRTKLNEMMLKHGFLKPNFKRFMVDIA
jgi:hypothetical protein